MVIANISISVYFYSFFTGFDKFMKEDISEIVKNPNFLNHRFHIMAVNIWLEDDSSGDIIPSEIALIEMTLKNGITRVS